LAKERNRNTSKYGRRSLWFGILSIVLPLAGVALWGFSSDIYVLSLELSGTVFWNLMHFSIVLAPILSILGMLSAMRQKKIAGRTRASTAGLIASCIGFFWILLATYSIPRLGSTIYFGPSMSDRFDEVNAQMQKELADTIKTSGERFVFNVLSLDVMRGVENTFYTGISNTDTGTRCFTVMLSCLKSLTPLGAGTAGCDGADGVNMLAGGAIPQSLQGTANYPTTALSPLWFKVFTETDIPAADVGVLSIYVQVGGGVRPSTYNMQAVVFKGSSDCGTDNGGIWSEYAKKEFYLRVK
jgi:hypothetical protein